MSLLTISISILLNLGTEINETGHLNMLHKLSPAFLQNIHCVIVVLTPLSMLNVSVADIHEGIASF